MTRPAIPEGEMDADALRKRGFWSVRNPFRGGDCEHRYTEALKESGTIIGPDKDNAGWAHAEQMAQCC